MAFMAVTLKANQTVTGLSLNLLSTGLTLFCYEVLFQSATTTRFPTIQMFQPAPIPWLSNIPYLGPILFSQRLITYIAIIMLPAIWYFLYRTKYGLATLPVGENPGRPICGASTSHATSIGRPSSAA